VNATLAVTLAMLRMIRAYQERTAFKVGYKPAGGISAAKDVLNYQFLMRRTGARVAGAGAVPRRGVEPAGGHRAAA